MEDLPPDEVAYPEPDPGATGRLEPREDDVEPSPEIPQSDGDEDPFARQTCGFAYPPPFQNGDRRRDLPGALFPTDVPDMPLPVAYPEPLPPYVWRMRSAFQDHLGPRFGVDEITMPGYQDELPLFERGAAWFEPRRCYELPTGARLLTQAEAYEMWSRMVEQTLWHSIDDTEGKRSVVLIRGAYPGTFEWHGNEPNRFNDTIVLLWRDPDGSPHVREYPVNTDTGARDFGYHSSSSLRPNRHYPYVNGRHRTYNALRMGLSSYPVRDDSNKNGHWDGDRNGWLDGGPADHDRNGSGHNIHMGSVDGDLSEIQIDGWSAGCQVIPGSDNWTEFIRHAWTFLGDDVDAYLLDARDIAPATWTPCEEPVGSHDCPFEIRTFPFIQQGNTEQQPPGRHDQYNCSEANEGGPEEVYVLNIRESGRLSASITVDDEDSIDPDIHLLWGDDADACMTRGHRTFEHRVHPGRYLLIVDTWVDGDGNVMAGDYRLEVDFTPSD